MRPPTSQPQSKNQFLNHIIVFGLFSGILITTLIWLRVPNIIITPLSWSFLGLIGLGSLFYLRRSTAPRPRWIMVLAALAAISLVYLFPELFRPVCGGMPRAFALNCPSECRIKECTKWVAGPSPECPNPGSGGGCCVSYETTCDPDCETKPPQDQPPTISGSVACSQWGGNGWCISNATLELTAIEPQGMSLQISGDVGGIPFSCPNGSGTVNCSVPLPEGEVSVNYIATSITTLTASGSKTYKFDTTSPQIDGSLNGVTGANGWYISLTEMNASVSDPGAGSGIATFEYNLNSAGWENYTGPLSISDGVHNLSLRASDLAGNFVEMDQIIQVDTVTPALNLSLTGISGSNGWYTSNIQINATVSDAGSGVGGFEYNLDNAGWTPYSGTLELSDGKHSLSLHVTDIAGNITEGTQSFSVDTLPPTIDSSVVGTEGANGWYVSDVQVSGSSSDSGSGLSQLEVSAYGSTYSIYSEPLIFSDGLHSYQFRASDNAGNLVELPLQQVKVDTVAPVIDLPESWNLGQAIIFKLQDDGSGLGSVRLVVEDENERFPKVAWEKKLSSYKFKGEIDWNGRFKDGQLAPKGGEYYAWVKVSDAAGNERMQAGQIIVPLTSIVEGLLLPSGNQTVELVSGTEDSGIIEEQTIPQTSTSDKTIQSELSSATNAPPPISFGGDSNGTAQPSSPQAGISSFNAGGQSNTPISNGQISLLWGATAAAAIGAFAVEAARKKEAQEAARRAANARINQARKLKQQAYALSQQLKKQKDAKDQALRNQAAYGRVFGRKEVDIEKELRSNLTKAQAERDALERAKQKAYDIYRKQEVAAQKKITPPKEKEKQWWEKAIDWVDEHQKEVSIGIGVAAGLVTTGLFLAAATTAIISLPVLLIAAGVSAIAAGASVAIGTRLLNSYYGRSLTTNLLSNIGAATLSAAITTGLGLFLFGGGLTSSLISFGNGVAAFCGNHQTICNFVEPLTRGVDFLEEAGLMVRGTIQTWKGDSQGAAETAFELQMEYMDGGIPGNAIAKEIKEEVGEWTKRYGDDVAEFVSLYGDEAVDLIRLHKEDAVKIIREYHENGIKLLKNYGDNAVDFVKRCEKLGINPTKILDNPPLPGQTLEGWMLGIDNFENPVNMQLKLNLAENEITQLRKESIHNPNSKLFAIGYGKDAPIPFNKFAENFGDEYEMSFLGLSDTNWQRFDNTQAYGDFWKINSDAIEWGVEERKIFILNIPYDLASNPSPSSTKRFTNAEIHLIEMPGNSYTRIDKGEYSFFVPNELLSSYQDYLPPELK